jgi:hypothetical protein
VNNALRGSVGFFFDGRFSAITEPGFCQVFSFFPAKERKTDWVIGLKNKRFINGRGCKKDLS